MVGYALRDFSLFDVCGIFEVWINLNVLAQTEDQISELIFESFQQLSGILDGPLLDQDGLDQLLIEVA